jgi:cytoskeletal protein RodZ
MMILVTPLTTMPLSEETPALQTIPARPQRTTTPTTLPEQPMAHPEGRPHAPQGDIKQNPTQHQDKLAGERVVEEARLAVCFNANRHWRQARPWQGSRQSGGSPPLP